MVLVRKNWLMGAVMALVGLVTLTQTHQVSAALPPEFERTAVATNLNSPTDFRFMPDGRIFITEKGGAIKIYKNGQLQNDPLITMVVLQTDTDEERGLLGIEPDPNFTQNGYLYVSYTTAANHDRLSRITVIGDHADTASEVVLLESNQLGNIYHHGGEVRFGPDGKLYWAMGMNTYNPNSQNLSNVHGKILRMNSDGSAPADNPFINTPDAIPQIWAYGLRNPFRFTFTPNGKLITGDVGGDQWEELDVIARGGNYGWPNVEGVCGCQYTDPIYTYHHTDPPAKAGSITSAMVYTGSTFPASYQNKFFIADYTLHWIKALTFDANFDSFISEQTFDDDAGTTVKLSQGPDGNIYQMNIYPGALFKIAPSGGNRAPTAKLTATPSNGLAPLPVSFSSAGSSDPDGTALTYAWNFGDGTTSTAPNPQKTYSQNGKYTATLTVSDGTKTSTATQLVTVGSTAPTAHITSPVNNSKYNAGNTISFSGTGTDDQDGTLPASSFNWKVVFHHADHTHPFRDNITGTSGTFDIPRAADNIDTTWYQIILTVTDSSGLTGTDTVDIKPNLVTLTFTTNHADATFTVDGIPYTGTRTEQAVVGVQRVVDAPSPQYIVDGLYRYNNWSDGLAKSHTITTPATNSTLTVTYDKEQFVPDPWQASDVGQPSVAGYSAYDSASGTYTVNGAGGDIWGPTDQFQYVHQDFTGDGTIIARVKSQTNTDGWAKSGIIIKETTTAGSKYVLLAVTPSNGVTFQYNFNGDGGSASYTFPNAWLKLTRVGNVFTAFTSANGTTWTQVGQTTLAMAANATAGLEVMSHKYDTLNTSTFDNVSVNSTQLWGHQDVGNPKIAGNTTINNGVHTITGAGEDIWGTADQFQFDYQSLPADGEIVARVSSFANTVNGYAKAGVMIKQSTNAGSAYALLGVTPAHGAVFQYGFNSEGGSSAYTFPNAWLKIKRVGNTITSFVSADGATWTPAGSATVTLTGTALIGMFVSSHDGSHTATAVFSNITVTKNESAPTALPSPWVGNDIGAPRLAGSTTFSNGAFTVNGAGDDIWGTADQSQFVNQDLPADGEIVTRVVSQGADTNGWAKAGIMIKQSTTAGSAYALLAVTPNHGTTFQYNFNGDAGIAIPYTFPNAWLKLTKVRDVITAYVSSNGTTWTQIGSTTVALAPNAKIGLFVTSHDGSKLNTSVFDNVTVTKNAAQSSLPAPWVSTNVGAPKIPGSASFANNAFTITGAGDDIWDTSDQSQFVNQDLTGNGQIIARVTSQGSDTDGWARAGVMIKQSTIAGSPYALLAVTPAHGITFQYNFNGDSGAAVPYTFPNGWLKLTRVLNTVTAYTSVDGTNWTLVGSTTLAMQPGVKIGLFVNSHNGSLTNTSVFDNVQVTQF